MQMSCAVCCCCQRLVPYLLRWSGILYVLMRALALFFKASPCHCTAQRWWVSSLVTHRLFNSVAFVPCGLATMPNPLQHARPVQGHPYTGQEKEEAVMGLLLGFRF